MARTVGPGRTLGTAGPFHAGAFHAGPFNLCRPGLVHARSVHARSVHARRPVGPGTVSGAHGGAMRARTWRRTVESRASRRRRRRSHVVMMPRRGRTVVAARRRGPRPVGHDDVGGVGIDRGAAVGRVIVVIVIAVVDAARKGEGEGSGQQKAFHALPAVRIGSIPRSAGFTPSLYRLFQGSQAGEESSMPCFPARRCRPCRCRTWRKKALCRRLPGEDPWEGGMDMPRGMPHAGRDFLSSCFGPLQNLSAGTWGGEQGRSSRQGP